MRLLNEGTQCRPFKPGEIRRVIAGADLAWPYHVRMEKDGSHSVILPVKFMPVKIMTGRCRVIKRLIII